ncbi:hypothetical protein LSUE1_G009540 [Lachnellula suecica]|uniref:Uncharacterized protein n=1 Tax=Lachnellula suecica TaxID=602035 RepID=A0A8T9BRL0_9HELO|nr:hypothetical protein LSUE1_G009540 [Lachnellula suecica]
MTAIAADVPLAYRQLLIDVRDEGVAFLFSTHFSEAGALQVPAQRAAAVYKITTQVAIEEFRRLVAIKAHVSDTNANIISPTLLMDDLWHAAVLDTLFYADLQAAPGLTIHHRPSGASEGESELRQVRLDTVKSLYKGYFSTDPTEHPWSLPQARHSLTGDLPGANITTDDP